MELKDFWLPLILAGIAALPGVGALIVQAVKNRQDDSNKRSEIELAAQNAAIALVDPLQKRLRESDEKVAALEARIEELEGEKAERERIMRDMITDSSQQIEKLEDQVTALKKENAALRSEMEAKLAAKDCEIAALKKRIEELEKEKEGR